MSYVAMRDHGPFGHLSWGIRHIFNSMVATYGNVLLWCQGTGRHHKDEIIKMSKEVVEALEAFAVAARTKSGSPEDGKEPFWILGGSEPTEADFSLYASLATVLTTETV
jgi:hypothetical protein